MSFAPVQELVFDIEMLDLSDMPSRTPIAGRSRADELYPRYIRWELPQEDPNEIWSAEQMYQENPSCFHYLLFEEEEEREDRDFTIEEVFRENPLYYRYLLFENEQEVERRESPNWEDLQDDPEYFWYVANGEMRGDEWLEEIGILHLHSDVGSSISSIESDPISGIEDKKGEEDEGFKSDNSEWDVPEEWDIKKEPNPGPSTSGFVGGKSKSRFWRPVPDSSDSDS